MNSTIKKVDMAFLWGTKPRKKQDVFSEAWEARYALITLLIVIILSYLVHWTARQACIYDVNLIFLLEVHTSTEASKSLFNSDHFHCFPQKNQPILMTSKLMTWFHIPLHYPVPVKCMGIIMSQAASKPGSSFLNIGRISTLHHGTRSKKIDLDYANALAVNMLSPERPGWPFNHNCMWQELLH